MKHIARRKQTNAHPDGEGQAFLLTRQNISKIISVKPNYFILILL